MGKNRRFNLLGIFLILTCCFLIGCQDMPDSENSASSVDANAENRSMSYEEFKKNTELDPGGVYIVDGDIPIASEEELEEFYYNYVANGVYQESDITGIKPDSLIVHQVNGNDAKWTDAQKKNITYCVSNAFESRKAEVVKAMADAAAAWEDAADVDFKYVSSQDGNCTNTNNNVVFDVNPVSGVRYLARAFFPNYSRSRRNVLINGTSFNPSTPNLTLTGILRHELGHVLGFRHEHTRPESGACFEDNDWRALTSYDPYSVMHYPQCNGKGNWSLTLTAKDNEGIIKLYGSRPTPSINNSWLIPVLYLILN